MITIDTRTIADKKKFVSWYLQTNSMIDDKHNVSVRHYDISIHGGVPAIEKEFEFTMGARSEPAERRVILIETYSISEPLFILEKCCGHFFKSSTTQSASIVTKDCKTYATGSQLSDSDILFNVVKTVFEYDLIENKGFMYGLDNERATIQATIFSGSSTFCVGNGGMMWVLS